MGDFESVVVWKLNGPVADESCAVRKEEGESLDETEMGEKHGDGASDDGDGDGENAEDMDV